MDVDETGQSDNIEENVVATSTSEEVQSKESSNTSPHSKSPFPNYGKVKTFVFVFYGVLICVLCDFRCQ